MADKTKSGSTEGHHKHKPPVTPAPPVTPVPDPFDIAVNEAIKQTYAFFDKPTDHNIKDLSHTAAKQLEQLLKNLLPELEPTHDKAAGTILPDHQFQIQQSKDKSDAKTVLKSAIANSTLEWTQAHIAWQQAVHTYSFERDSAEFALRSAVDAARQVYQPTLSATNTGGAGGMARYVAFKLAVVEAIETFMAAIAAAASARGAAEGSLRSAFIELISGIYAAQGTAQSGMVTAEQTFWQSCQAAEHG